MNIQSTNCNVQNRRDNGIKSPCAGAISNVLPEVQTPHEEKNSHTGVSTRNASLPILKRKPRPEDIPHWYTLRCAYGRERMAYEMFSNNGFEAFYPTITTTRETDGKIEKIEESRIPNILFAYGSFEHLKEFVYDNNHDDTKYLRFYYNQHHDGTKEPLVIPQRQMNSLMKICGVKVDDKQLDPFVVEKFKTGQLVRVKDGPFAGVEGIVKRYKGQQRVGIVVEGLFTVTTAYIPSAYLQPLY